MDTFPFPAPWNTCKNEPAAFEHSFEFLGAEGPWKIPAQAKGRVQWVRSKVKEVAGEGGTDFQGLTQPAPSGIPVPPMPPGQPR